MKHVSNKDFCAWIQREWDVFNKYYVKTDTTSFYIVVLILHFLCHINYIKNNWSFKWVKPVLNNVTKFWETYWDQSHWTLVSEIAAVYNNSEKKREETWCVWLNYSRFRKVCIINKSRWISELLQQESLWYQKDDDSWMMMSRSAKNMLIKTLNHDT